MLGSSEESLWPISATPLGLKRSRAFAWGLGSSGEPPRSDVNFAYLHHEFLLKPRQAFAAWADCQCLSDELERLLRPLGSLTV